MSMFSFVITAVIAAIWCIISVCKDSEYSTAAAFSSLSTVIFNLIIYLILTGISVPFSAGFQTDEIIDNTNSVPQVVKYVQYHPFDENTVESAVVMPAQTKILHKVKVISTTPIEIPNI